MRLDHEAQARMEEQAAQDLPDILGFRRDGLCARCETVKAEDDGYCRVCRSRAEAEKAVRAREFAAAMKRVRRNPQTGEPINRRRKK